MRKRPSIDRLTTDVVANDLYLQAMALEERASLISAMNMLEQAIARDPRFVRAYCALARIHIHLYEGEEHTVSHLQNAEESISKAARLQPDSGEVHLVRAEYLARAPFAIMMPRAPSWSLPGAVCLTTPRFTFETAVTDRRQGRWTEALRNFDRASRAGPAQRWNISETPPKRYSFGAALSARPHDSLDAPSPSRHTIMGFGYLLPHSHWLSGQISGLCVRSSMQFWPGTLLLCLPAPHRSGIAPCSSAIWLPPIAPYRKFQHKVTEAT